MKLALNNLSTRHKLIDGKKVYDCVAVDDFVAKGKIMVQAGQVLVKGTFER